MRVHAWLITLWSKTSTESKILEYSISMIILIILKYYGGKTTLLLMIGLSMIITFM